MFPIVFFSLALFFGIATPNLVQGQAANQPGTERVLILGDNCSSTYSRELEPFLYILEDPTNTLTAQQLQSPPYSNSFKPLSTVKTLNRNSIYWLHLTVQAKNRGQAVYSIYIPEDYFEVYGRNPKALAVGGKLVPYSRQTVPQPFPIFTLSLPSALALRIAAIPNLTYYIRLRHESGYRFKPSRIYLYDEFWDQAYRKPLSHYQGLFFGGITTLAILILAVSITSKQFRYFFYPFFAFNVMAYLYARDGYAFEFLWPNHPYFNKNALLLFSPLSLVTFAIFSDFYFAWGKSAWGKRLLLYACPVVYCFISLFAFLEWGSFECHLRVQTIIGVIFPLLVLMLCAVHFRKNPKSSLFFLIGNICLLAGCLIWFLVDGGYLEAGHYYHYSLHFGLFLQALMILCGMVFAVWNLRKEKEKAQENEISAQRASLELQKRMLEAFARFVPADFLRHLGKEDVTDVKLGDAVEHKMTVLFSDIRSFTSISENLTPSDNFLFLNNYLGQVSPIIRKHHGFIDKYIGDAVMALFPDSPENALEAAIEMVGVAHKFSHETEKKIQTIRIGVGIHSGQLILGTIGEEKRMEGTVISDVVNVASRLESMTKKTGLPILISADTFAEIKSKEKYRTRHLGVLDVPGRQEGIEVVAIEGDE